MVGHVPDGDHAVGARLAPDAEQLPQFEHLARLLLLLPKQFIELALQQVVIDLGIDEVNHVAARYWSLNKRW
jgi:hypothetical protein